MAASSTTRNEATTLLFTYHTYEYHCSSKHTLAFVSAIEFSPASMLFRCATAWEQPAAWQCAAVQLCRDACTSTTLSSELNRRIRW